MNFFFFFLLGDWLPSNIVWIAGTSSFVPIIIDVVELFFNNPVDLSEFNYDFDWLNWEIRGLFAVGGLDEGLD